MSKKQEMMREHLRVFNPYGYAGLSSAVAPMVFVVYVPGETGRLSRSAKWHVVHLNEKTDPDSYWEDQGHKTFSVYGRDLKEPQRLAALSWAEQHYGVIEWAKDPWGAWHPAARVARVDIRLKAIQKELKA